MPAYSIQFRRGTAADHSAFTGELAEITIDITNNRVILHDGETAGGIPLAKVSDLPIDVGDLTDVNGHIAAAISELAGSDISTATYDNVSYSTWLDSSPQDIEFSPDGTKMFVVGSENEQIYQYSLTTGFDLSTVVSSPVYGSSISQAEFPLVVKFNTDGTKMYVGGGSSDNIHQYTLNTGFDINGGGITYDNVTVSPPGSMLSGIAFNTDGTKMFVTTYFDGIFQYSLSTGFDISTATYDNVNIAPESGWLRNIVFNDDGTKLYSIHFSVASGTSIRQYSLSTGFDLNTFSSDFSSFEATEDSMSGMAFNTDFTKMYLIAAGSDDIYQYSIDVA